MHDHIAAGYKHFQLPNRPHPKYARNMAKVIQFPGSNSHDDEARGGFSFARGRYPNLMLFDLGLSDSEVDMLVSGDPASWRTIVEIAPQLTGADLASVPILRYAHALLSAIYDDEPVRSTAKGNLPAAMVKSLHSGAFADARSLTTRANREDDSLMLSWTRRLCQFGGLLSFRNGEFRLTKAGRAAVETANYSEIYRLLLECHLRKPQILDAYDRYGDGGVIGRSLPFLLFAARDSNHDFLYEEDFAALLSAVAEGTIFDSEELSRAVALKMFERFGVPFGLFSPGPSVAPPIDTGEEHYDRFGRWRRTPLFTRVFRWHADPPPHGVMRPQQAAMRWMNAIHEIGAEDDGAMRWYVKGYCMRAIERCPEDPDAYVVWAHIHAEAPETALAIIDRGITVSAGRAPDTPEGMSPWSDHEFRGVMRLHFLRAETLEKLERYDEAFAEYKWLLELDPRDAIGAADCYVPALILNGDNDKAEELLRSRAGEDDCFAAWNRVLSAYARGDKQAARARLEQALQVNPYVPECLLDRVREPMPSRYVPGDISEATVYENLAFSAWKAVRGAREWLKRNADPHDTANS